MHTMPPNWKCYACGTLGAQTLVFFQDYSKPYLSCTYCDLMLSDEKKTGNMNKVHDYHVSKADKSVREHNSKGQTVFGYETTGYYICDVCAARTPTPCPPGIRRLNP